jgi:hypothetical protein
MANLYVSKKHREEVSYLTENIKKTNYRFLFLKGTALNLILYHNHQGIRQIGDIDLLITPNSENVINYMLENLEYQCLASAEEKKAYPLFFQHFAPIHGKNRISIEIHHRFTQDGDGYEFNYDRIFKESTTSVLSENKLEVPIPSIEDILLNLCYHQYQHEFRETVFFLKAHSDIFNLIYNLGKSINWDTFIKNVIADSVQFPITYSLYYTNFIFNQFLDIDIVPKFVLDAIMPKDFDKEKNAIVSRFLLTNQPFGYWRKSYIERLFLSVSDLYTLLCKEYFISISNAKLQKASEKYGLDYDKLCSFTSNALIENEFL